MPTYSVIILLDRATEEGRRLLNLQYLLSKRFHGMSAVQLPPHLTVIKWKYMDLIPDTFVSLIHLRDITCDVLLETIELLPKRKAIFYKVVRSKELFDISNRIYTLLIDAGISKDDITPITKFHLTLAYKDYTEKEIVEIFTYLKQSKLPSYFRLSAYKMAICYINKGGKWSIMQPFRKQDNELY
jgi:hypothetical protein